MDAIFTGVYATIPHLVIFFIVPSLHEPYICLALCDSRANRAKLNGGTFIDGYSLGVDLYYSVS